MCIYARKRIKIKSENKKHQSFIIAQLISELANKKEREYYQERYFSKK